jgi:hypothetical protein
MVFECSKLFCGKVMSLEIVYCLTKEKRVNIALHEDGCLFCIDAQYLCRRNCSWGDYTCRNKNHSFWREGGN